MTTSMKRIVALGLAQCQVLAFVGGCEKASPRETSLPLVSASQSAVAPPTPEVRLEALWLRASTLDPLDLAALAEHEGAEALAAALEQPSRSELARAALPLAPDVDGAFPLLTARVSKGLSPEADLDLMLLLSAKPQAFGERLQPELDSNVLAQLETVAKTASEPRVRAKAETLVSRLRERGLER